MKRLFLLALPVLFILACKPEIETHRTEIKSLIDDWSHSTKELTDMSNMVTEFTESSSQYLVRFSLDSEKAKVLDPNIVVEYKESIDEYSLQTSEGFGSLQNEMSEFNKMWIENSEKIKQLEQGLESGKFNGNVAETIKDLTGLVEQSKEKVQSWEKTANEIREKTKPIIVRAREIFEMAESKNK